jgi:hypothetical protein
MKYIRRVRVVSPGTHNQHIAEVQCSTSSTGQLSTWTRKQVVEAIDGGRETFRSHDDRTLDEAAVVTRTTSSGLRYIATVADRRETNNLLNLPRF